jgi:hypothetical protein
MGTQVGRYALRTAELDGEDHHVGLFIAIDGPFRGSSIPLGLQEAAKFLAQLHAKAQDLVDGLTSDAAKQLLDFYDIHARFHEYYHEVNALGLPRHCRNIGIASGSGTGNRVDGKAKGSVGTFGQVNMGIMYRIYLSVPWPPFVKPVWVKLTGVDLEIYSDRIGRVFYGDLTVLGISILPSERTLGSAHYVDLAPGGMRNSGKEVRNEVNDAFDGFLGFLMKVAESTIGKTLLWLQGIRIDIPLMEGSLDNHCYMPTYTALDYNTSDLNWQPPCDAGECENGQTPFDNAYYENENAGHVCGTAGSLDFTFREMEKFENSRDLNRDGILDGCQCAKPPRNMLAWWPLEEPDPPGNNGVLDIAGGNSGIRLPLGIGPTYTPDGKVGGAFSFDGSDDYIHVVNRTLDIGTSDFSIEAWVRPTAELDVEPVFEHIHSNAEPPDEVRGYGLYVTSGEIVFLLRDADPFPASFSGPAVLGDGGWHHVGVTVDRDAQDGLKMFADGKLVATYDVSHLQGSLTNPASIFIGRSEASDSFFHGSIDELAIYKRALEPNEVKAVYGAGALGKCDEACYLPRMKAFCPGDEPVKVPLTICNYSHDARNYLYYLQGLPAGQGCDVDGPDTDDFNYLDDYPVHISCSCCRDVHILVDRPDGLSGWLTACYEGIVLNTDTQAFFSSQGALVGTSLWCPQLMPLPPWWESLPSAKSSSAASESGDSPCSGSSSVLGVLTGETAELRFEVTNVSDPDGELRYRLEPISAEINEPSQIPSLNGLPAGTAVEGTIEGLAIGETTIIPVNVEFTDHEPFDLQEVLLLTDADDDTNWELAASVKVRSQWCGDPAYLYSIGDLNLNCLIEGKDFALLGSAWRSEPGDPRWNPDFDIGIPADNVIDMRDLAVLADHWLETGMFP